MRAAALVILAIGCWSIGTIREGHDWGGDNCMYVMHAQNLLDGRAYADTPYVYNAESGRLPRSYPPVFPALLAPVVAGFGVDWGAMKVEVTLCLVGALFALAWAWRDTLSPPFLLATLVLVGTNPVLWDFKDSVLSEFPFLLIVSAAVLAARAADRAGPGRARLGWAAALGALAYLAYGTRAVGALILPATWLFELVRGRRVSAVSAVSLAVFAPLALLQNLLLRSEADFVRYKLDALGIELIAGNLVEVPLRLASFFGSAGAGWGSWAVGAPLALLALVGLWCSARDRSLGLGDAFLIVYLGFILTVSMRDTNPPQRYLVPVFPFFVAAAMRGLQAFRPLWDRVVAGSARLRAAPLALLLAAAAAAYATSYARLDFSRIEGGITSPSAEKLYRYVREETEADALFVFFEPRVLALYTGRASTELQRGTPADWLRFSREVGADYWVRLQGHPLPAAFRGEVERVYDNRGFAVYRFLQRER